MLCAELSAHVMFWSTRSIGPVDEPGFDDPSRVLKPVIVIVGMRFSRRFAPGIT